MTLKEKRLKFSLMVAKLILYAHKIGRPVAIKDVHRCIDCPVGRKTSLHKDSLAADLDMYIDGEYQTDGAAHAPLHDKWLDMGGNEPIARDMNHYSVRHGNRR